MFHLPVREELADKNRGWKIKMLPENNARDRVLSADELDRLLPLLPHQAAQILHFAYLTGMRVSEIFQPNWDKVDQIKRIIKLEAEDTKTCELRVVFLGHQAYDILQGIGKVRFLEHNRVFTYKGAPLKKIKKALLMPAGRWVLTIR